MRRKGLIQAKVCSTIQRLGKTSKPMACAERSTISIFHVPVLAAALAAAIGVDALDDGKQTARAAIEQQGNAVAILDAGGMDRGKFIWSSATGGVVPI